MGALAFSASILAVSAQSNPSSQAGDTPAPSQESTSSTNAVPAPEIASSQAFRQEQLALAQEMRGLIEQGASAEQMDAWRKQNADRLASQVQQATTMATASKAAGASHPMSLVSEVQIPAGASQEMADFLTTRADLQNRLVQLNNQQVSNAPAVFRQQNAAELDAQVQRTKDIAAQSAQVSIPTPPPLALPPNASPQLQAFLTLHDQLMREEIALKNQYLSAEPAAREAALAQWRKQNAARIGQLPLLAQSLSASTLN